MELAQRIIDFCHGLQQWELSGRWFSNVEVMFPGASASFEHHSKAVQAWEIATPPCRKLLACSLLVVARWTMTNFAIN